MKEKSKTRTFRGNGGKLGGAAGEAVEAEGESAVTVAIA